ncbi:MAG: hypothetical protein WBP64_14195 [Nitrososphaeraceae archaeon]
MKELELIILNASKRESAKYANLNGSSTGIQQSKDNLPIIGSNYLQHHQREASRMLKRKRVVTNFKKRRR